jgi:mRNA interferase RelE/StbE
MKRYRITFLPGARRQFTKLPKNIQKRLQKAIDGLSTNPLPDGVKKLTDGDNTYRIRVGDYRIIYYIFNTELIVFVVKVKHRRDAY